MCISVRICGKRSDFQGSIRTVTGRGRLQQRRAYRGNCEYGIHHHSSPTTTSTNRLNVQECMCENGLSDPAEGSPHSAHSRIQTQHLLDNKCRDRRHDGCLVAGQSDWGDSDHHSRFSKKHPGRDFKTLIDTASQSSFNNPKGSIAYGFMHTPPHSTTSSCPTRAHHPRHHILAGE